MIPYKQKPQLRQNTITLPSKNLQHKHPFARLKVDQQARKKQDDNP